MNFHINYMKLLILQKLKIKYKFQGLKTIFNLKLQNILKSNKIKGFLDKEKKRVVRKKFK